MKTFLQISFFFLLVTQICFTQLYPQSSKIKLNTKSGITDRMDKHHKIIGTNIHSGKNNEFSTPNFNDKLPSEIDPFEVNNNSYPFQNDRIIPDVLQKNSPSIIRMLSSQSQFYVIDTAIVLSTSDTVRHLYTFNPNAKRTSDLTQKLNGDTWVNSSRLTNEYDDANNMLSELYEYWENGQWVNYFRHTYTYDAQGNMLSAFGENWENGQWVNSDRYTYTYDAQGNMLSYLYEYWENGQWVYSYRYTYTYDAQGNMLSDLYERWENAQLVNSDRYTYTYDAQGNMLSKLYEAWSSQWVYSYRVTYTYDAQGNMLSYLYEAWNSQWVNSYRVTYTYDAQGNILSELYENWENGQWVNSSRWTYTYDAQGNILSELYENWQNGQWVNLSRSTYTFDAQGNMLSAFDDSWINGQWVNYDRSTYTYDAQGNMLSYLYEYWENAQLVNSYRVTYTYDAQGCLTSVWSYIWQNSTWTPINFKYGFRVFDNAGNYYYLGRGYNFTLSYKLIVTGVESERGNVPGTYTLFQNYPNPFNPNTKIKYSIPKSSQVIIKIFNTLGEELKTLVNDEKSPGAYEVIWNAEKLSSGVYFYQLKTGSFIETKKMILLR